MICSLSALNLILCVCVCEHNFIYYILRIEFQMFIFLQLSDNTINCAELEQDIYFPVCLLMLTLNDQFSFFGKARMTFS